MKSLCRQISRVHSHLIRRGIEPHQWQCSQFARSSTSTSRSAMQTVMTAKKNETETAETKLSLTNRFLYASLCIITLEKIITPEETIQIYGYQQRGNRGRNATKRPHDEEQGESLQKWEAWLRCNDMSQEAAQEQFIKLMNGIRARVGQPEI